MGLIFSIVMRTLTSLNALHFVLSCLRLDERWSLKIEVEAAAGGVFAHHQAQAVGKARRPFIGFP